MSKAVRATHMSRPSSRADARYERKASAKRTSAPASRHSPEKPKRSITTRTSKDRASRSPIARVVNRRDAPTRLRRFVFIAVGVALAAITLMMMVVVFQTRLAETQLGIDDIETQISAERSRYDQLRLERSILREPQRLVAEATALGMVPGSKTDFRTVEPLAVAAILVSSAGMDPSSTSSSADALERYGAVKALFGGAR